MPMPVPMLLYSNKEYAASSSVYMYIRLGLLSAPQLRALAAVILIRARSRRLLFYFILLIFLLYNICVPVPHPPTGTRDRYLIFESLLLLYSLWLQLK